MRGDGGMEEVKGRKNELRLSPVEIQMSGNVIRITLVTVGPNDGLIVGQAATLFNISESAIHKHLKKHDIVHKKIVTGKLQLLKNSGVVNSKAIHAIFIPRYGLRELLRVIDTDEAKAAYHQLCDDAEELLRVKSEVVLLNQKVAKQVAELLETAGQLKAALACSAIDQARLRLHEAKIFAQDEQIAHLEAKLDAASHHISLGGNRKAPRFNLPIYIRQPDDIFKKPTYAIDLVKKSVGEMNDVEHKRFALQHSSKVAVGVSGSLIRTMNEIGVNNPMIRDKADLLHAAAKDLHSEIMPSQAGLLALNSGYMNEGRHMHSTAG